MGAWGDGPFDNDDAADARTGASIGYRPGLDGLRALSVLAVIGYHANIGWLRGGYLGVDVFFVLSGFLITSLLLEEMATTHRVDLLAFWGRRVRRLLPALLLVLAATFVYGRFFASPLAVERIRSDGLATLGFANNWNYAANGVSYFERFGAFSSPLRHTWSLGIEEQFYLLWPLAFVGSWCLARRFARPRRVLLGVVIAGAIASAVEMARLAAGGADPSRAYFGTDTRAQALLVGAALVLLVSRADRSARNSSTGWLVVVVCAGVLVFLVTSVGDNVQWMYRGGFLLAAAAAAVLTLAASRGGNIVSMVLSTSPLVAIGRISYGLYLWHLPVNVALRNEGLHGTTLLICELGATAMLAWLSFVLLERPARRWHPSRPSRARYAPVIVLAAAIAAVGVATSGLVAARLPSHAVAADVSARTVAGQPVVRTEPATPPARVFFAGDSVMFTLGFFARWSDVMSAQWSVWAPIGCGTLRADVVAGGKPKDECRRWPIEWAQQVDESNPDIIVLQLGPWDVADHIVDGITLRPGTPEYAAYFTRELETARGIAARRGGHLVVLDVPCFEDVDALRVRAANDVLAGFAAGHPESVAVIRWSALLCPDGTPTSIDGKPLRPDGRHFDGNSGPIVARWLAPRLVHEVCRRRWPSLPASARACVDDLLVADRRAPAN